MSEPVTMTAEVAAALRAPFDPAEVGHLPKMWCRDCSQSQQKTCDRHRTKNKCDECGGFHSDGTLHLDFVGHAEVTDRFLSVDPAWDWQPMALTPEGRPAFDNNGGLWIRLTIAGVTRTGYGDAPGKSGGNAIKEAIGDALRNAGMRFGVALDLWRKTEKAERTAAQNNPEPIEPDGKIIGRGDHRVDRDEWERRVSAAAQIRPFEAATERLKAMWGEANGDPAMQAVVRVAAEHLKMLEAEAKDAAAAHEAEKAAALADQPPPAAEHRPAAAPDDPVVQAQAAEFDANWRAKLKDAAEAKDAKLIRQLIAVAKNANAPELKAEGMAALDALRVQR